LVSFFYRKPVWFVQFFSQTGMIWLDFHENRYGCLDFLANWYGLASFSRKQVWFGIFFLANWFGLVIFLSQTGLVW